MSISVTEKRAQFRKLHESGCFLIPNPWDVGSAIILQSLGFEALASTSAGLAWALGRPDYGITLPMALSHLEAVCAAVDLPVNADFENGFADAPGDVARNVTACMATGVAGLSIEDSVRGQAEPLYPFELAVARIKAARKAIDAAGGGVLLTARTEGFIAGRPDMEETLRRLKAFAEAGADCLYAPAIRTPEQIKAVVQAVAPKPVNMLVYGHATVAELKDLGVRRISIGGSLAGVAYAAFMRAAREMLDPGRFDAFKQSGPERAQLNPIFAKHRAEG